MARLGADQFLSFLEPANLPRFHGHTRWRGSRKDGSVLSLASVRLGTVPTQNLKTSLVASLALTLARAVGVLMLASAPTLRAGTTVEWKGGEGSWEDLTMWEGALPSRTAEARINGTRERPSRVTLSATDALLSRLGVGDGGNSRAALVLDGRALTVIAGCDVGKYDGSEAAS